jgi:hypothetical protein
MCKNRSHISDETEKETPFIKNCIIMYFIVLKKKG